MGKKNKNNNRQSQQKGKEIQALYEQLQKDIEGLYERIGKLDNNKFKEELDKVKKNLEAKNMEGLDKLQSQALNKKRKELNNIQNNLNRIKGEVDKLENQHSGEKKQVEEQLSQKEQLVKDLFDDIAGKSNATPYVTKEQKEILAEFSFFVQEGGKRQQELKEKLTEICQNKEITQNINSWFERYFADKDKEFTRNDIKEIFKNTIKDEWKKEINGKDGTAGWYAGEVVFNTIRAEIARNANEEYIQNNPVEVGVLSYVKEYKEGVEFSNFDSNNSNKAPINGIIAAIEKSKKYFDNGGDKAYTILIPINKAEGDNAQGVHWCSGMVRIVKEGDKYKIEAKFRNPSDVMDEQNMTQVGADVFGQVKLYLGDAFTQDNLIFNNKDSFFNHKYKQGDGSACGLVSAQMLIDEYLKPEEQKREQWAGINNDNGQTVNKYKGFVDQLFKDKFINKEFDKLIGEELKETYFANNEKAKQAYIQKLEGKAQKLEQSAATFAASFQNKEGSSEIDDGLKKIINNTKQTTNETLGSKYYGLGAEVEETEKGYFKITKIYKGSALENNVNVGSIITEIGGQDLSKLETLDDKIILARTGADKITIKADSQSQKNEKIEEMGTQVDVSRKIFNTKYERAQDLVYQYKKTKFEGMNK